MNYHLQHKKKQRRLKSNKIEKEFLSIHRRIYNYVQFGKYFPDGIFKRFRLFSYLIKSYKKLRIKCKLEWKYVQRFLFKMVPMFEMIRHYRLEYFLPDFITGVEVIS